MSEWIVLALGVALSPLPILAILLFLSSDRARVTATAFWLAWLVGVSAATVALVVAVERSHVTDGDSIWLDIAAIGIGSVFVGIASRLSFGARAGGSAAPAWLGAFDRFGAQHAAGLALLLSCANPKNLALLLGAAVAISEAGDGRGELARSSAVFVAVAASGVSLPLVAYAAFPGRLQPPLNTLRGALTRRGRTIAAIVGFAVGALFILQGIRGL